MKKKSRKLSLHKETIRTLSNLALRNAAGGHSHVAACISAQEGDCTTWNHSDCGDCGSDATCVGLTNICTTRTE